MYILCTIIMLMSITITSLSHTPSFILSGTNVLAHILPHHANLSQVYLLMVTNLLGKTCIDIPYSAQFDTETLEELFHIVDTSSMAQQFKISGDAAHVLLAITRSLLHQVLECVTVCVGQSVCGSKCAWVKVCLGQSVCVCFFYCVCVNTLCIVC